MKKIYFLLITCLLISEAAMTQTYSGGDGTSENPFWIANTADLGYLSANIVNEKSKYFIQTADIVFTDADFENGGAFYNSGEGFIPIGNSINYFQGSYNGQNHTIDNLYIYRGAVYQGLFGYASNNATISNLGVTNVDITGYNIAGGLLGYGYTKVSISNCYVTGTVTGGNMIGGLIGAVVNGAHDNACSVINCYADVSVSATGWAGGLVGSLDGNEYASNISCYGSFALGNVTSVGAESHVGGLVGVCRDVNISNCYARGAVSGTGSSAVYAGGFIGWANTYCVVTNCYSTGTVAVNGTASPANKVIGGLIGKYSSTGSSIGYSYWDTETSGIISAGNGIGKTTLLMKTVGTYFPNWDFSLATGPWAINGTDNDGYPFLRFQAYTPAHIFFGTTNADWSTTTNWSEGSLPSAVVFVPNVTNDPVIASTNSITCTNLTIESGAVLTLNADGSGASSLTASGTVTNNAGNTGLVLKSVANATSSLIHNTAGVAATVERYVTGDWTSGSNGWHLISSPVATQSISAFETAGVGNGYDFYGYDEPTNYWMNYKDAGFSTWNGSTNLEVGQGYVISYETTQSAKFFQGNLNSDPVTFNNLSITASKGEGWHLIGNPFASAINWSNANWVKTGFNSYAKVRVGSSYMDVTDDYANIIPSANGFWVKASNATNTITIPTEARVHDDQNWLKSTPLANYVILKATDLTNNTIQESIIRLHAESSDGFDEALDAPFMAGEAPWFYSRVEDKDISLNTIPSFTNKTIDMGFVKSEGDVYSIRLDLEICAPNEIITLVDKKLNQKFELTNGLAYTFTSSQDDDPNRFLLQFGAVGIEETTPEQFILVWKQNNLLYLKGAENYHEAGLFDLQGRLLQRTTLSGDDLQTMPSPEQTGMYLIRLLGENHTVSKKLIIK